ncbi:MAG: M4 family metallopeptidase [Anaerolineae bacterium]|nr:M4 family metallopeptidase [Anaerolineae bacterium]
MSVVLALVVALTLFASAVSAHPHTEPFAYQAPDGALDPEGIARLVKDSGGAKVEVESATGAVRFVRLQGKQIETLAVRLGVHKSFSTQADAFFAEYGSIFGIRNAAAELLLVETATDRMGETHLTYQQVYQGVPVFAGTLRVHFDAQKRIKVVNGAFVPGIGVNVTPSLGIAEAEAVAERVVAGLHLSTADAVPGALDAKAVASALYVYHEGLIKGVPGAARLVYEVEVSNGYDVREFVYVDAHKGSVVNQITGIQQDLDRRVYSYTRATLLWQEGDAYPWAGNANATDTMEINSLITVTQHTYNFFFNTFGRDSYDGNGIPIDAIFNDATLNGACPNAHWTGSFIGFCPGLSVDDIIAHEMGHAYTQYTDNLIYQWQPGALNEAYSDIWGETVDLINNFQTDEPDAPRTEGLCSAYYGSQLPTLHVSAPAGMAGEYMVGGANFNPAPPLAVTATVVLVNDGNAAGGSVTDGCEAPVNTDEVSGSIALVDRGTCGFSIKVMNAQAAGAVGVIVVNNAGDSVMSMGGSDPNIVIPSVFLGQGNGDLFKAALPGLVATIDLGGSEMDDSIRWLMGEDGTSFGGAIRDLWTPSCFGNPDKVSDLRNYYCGTDDNGGVHLNAGVPSHAYALLADGGSYNGQTINAIGLVKAAHIYWRAQSVYQIPVSDFSDHADALEQSCADLIGENLAGFDGAPSGEVIAQSDCDAVSAAVAAVELRAEPTQCGFEPMLKKETPQVCSDINATPFYSETFDTDPGAEWTLSNTSVYTTYTPRNWVWADTMPITLNTSAARTGGFYAFDYLNYGDCRPGGNSEAGVMYLDSPVITVPSSAGEEHLIFTFDHYVATEEYFDGGNVWVSVNGGAWQLVGAEDFVFNPYNQAALLENNPLAGQPGFGGTDEATFYGSWGQSQVDLADYAGAGDEVRLRFAFGVDACNGRDGWYLDQVAAYHCVAPASDIAVTPSALESEQFNNVLVTLPLTISNASNDASLEWELPGAGPAWAQANEAANGVLSGFFTDYGVGVYNADDFVLDFDTALTSINAGAILAGQVLSPEATIDWYIYPDAGGSPAGHPEDGGGTEVWHYTSTASSAGVTVVANNIMLDLVAAGQNVQLPAGVYWLIVSPSYAYNGGVNPWIWADGVDERAVGVFIDPNDLFGAGFTDWTPQVSVFGVHDLVFSVEGVSVCTLSPWLAVGSIGGSVAKNSEVALGVHFNSHGLAIGTYTDTLCLASDDPDTALLQVPVTLTVLAGPLTSAEVQGSTILPYYPETVISWTVELLPLDAARPFTYTINAGSPMTTLNNTVSFTRTGDLVGIHSILFAAWNPVMSEPVTTTWQYEIIAHSEHRIYLPLILR